MNERMINDNKETIGIVNAFIAIYLIEQYKIKFACKSSVG